MPRSQYTESEQQTIVRIALDTTFESAAKTHRVSVGTIRRWQRKHGIRRKDSRQQQDGKGTSVLDESGAEATLCPEIQLHEEMDNAAATFAARKLRWFDGRRRHRRAIAELEEIVTGWQLAQREFVRGDDAGVRPGGTGSSKPTPRAARSRDRGKKRDPRPSEAHKVYVFDATPIAALAVDDSAALRFLRKIVDGRHEMVVPEAVIEQVRPKTRSDSPLWAVLGCKYVKRVALGDHDKRVADMLCKRVHGPSILQASVVVVASNCLASLRRRCKKRGWSLEIVTGDLDDIRALVRRTNLEALPERPHGAWHFLPLSRTRGRTSNDPIGEAPTAWRV